MSNVRKLKRRKHRVTTRVRHALESVQDALAKYPKAVVVAKNTTFALVAAAVGYALAYLIQL